MKREVVNCINRSNKRVNFLFEILLAFIAVQFQCLQQVANTCEQKEKCEQFPFHVAKIVFLNLA